MPDFNRIHYATIVILSIIFPLSAFAYQIFQREKHLQELKTDFKLLGLGNTAIDPTEKYKKSYGPWNFLIHSTLPALLSMLGAGLLFAKAQTLQGFFDFQEGKTVVTALRYGFVGAYIFSIQLVYRRYTTMDLQPTVYMNCTITLIAGLAFNYTAFLAIDSLRIQNADTGLGAGIFAILAFSLGYFPLLAIGWFNKVATDALGQKERRADSLPLSVIDGISQFHETRLRDEGIDNVQNLASAKIDELLLNTRFNVQQVLEWIDQAFLHLYIDPGKIDSFRRGGVRTISDFHALWAPYHTEYMEKDGRFAKSGLPKELSDARQNRALQLQSTPEHLDALYTTTLTGPNMAFIGNYWKNLREHIQERQSTAAEEIREKARSVVKETQITIFKKISEKPLYDKNRQALGEIAETLAPEWDQDVPSDDEIQGQPEVSAGLAWWLWWITDRVDNDKDFTKQAIHYYEKALEAASDDPKTRYEMAKLYIDRTEDYEKAREHADKALALSRESGDHETALMTLPVLALICLKAGDSGAGIACITEAMGALEERETDVEHMETFANVKDTVEKMVCLFEEDHLPEEVSVFQEKIEDQWSRCKSESHEEALSAAGHTAADS